MNWIRIAVDIEDDPQVRAMARYLKVRVSEAVGLVVRVLARLPKHARDGDLAAFDREIVEDWCDWHGKPGAFADEFFARFCVDGRVKGWERWNGAAIREADRERDRKRELREQQRAAPVGQRADVRPDVRDVSPEDVTGRHVNCSSVVEEAPSVVCVEDLLGSPAPARRGRHTHTGLTPVAGVLGGLPA